MKKVWKNILFFFLGMLTYFLISTLIYFINH